MQAWVYTDGCALGNPGPGGWCAIVRVEGNPVIDLEVSGSEPIATNNQMEMRAAIVGIEKAAGYGATRIILISDSQYLVKGLQEWIPRWIKNGWKRSDGGTVKNLDLWMELAVLRKKYDLVPKWIRGHNGHKENERCDQVANQRAEEAKVHG